MAALQTFLDSYSDPIALLSADGVVAAANRAWLASGRPEDGTPLRQWLEQPARPLAAMVIAAAVEETLDRGAGHLVVACDVEAGRHEAVDVDPTPGGGVRVTVRDATGPLAALADLVDGDDGPGARTQDRALAEIVDNSVRQPLLAAAWQIETAASRTADPALDEAAVRVRRAAESLSTLTVAAGAALAARSALTHSEAVGALLRLRAGSAAAVSWAAPTDPAEPSALAVLHAVADGLAPHMAAVAAVAADLTGTAPALHLELRSDATDVRSALVELAVAARAEPVAPSVPNRVTFRVEP